MVMLGPLSPYDPPISILMYYVCNVGLSSFTSRRKVLTIGYGPLRKNKAVSIIKTVTPTASQ
jgi:hypothetical protein